MSRRILDSGINRNDYQPNRIYLKMFHILMQDKPAKLVENVIEQCMCKPAAFIRS